MFFTLQDYSDLGKSDLLGAYVDRRRDLVTSKRHGAWSSRSRLNGRDERRGTKDSGKVRLRIESLSQLDQKIMLER